MPVFINELTIIGVDIGLFHIKPPYLMSQHIIVSALIFCETDVEGKAKQRDDRTGQKVVTHINPFMWGCMIKG